MITSITFSSAPIRKVPKAGDERFLKGRGVWQIRQQEYSKFYRAWVVAHGRPVWEWVDKGSERDRTSEAWKSAGGFNR